ncbi:MAG: Lrp/AsnC family transcriptional regulator [bacterium]
MPKLTKKDKELIRYIQNDLPYDNRPFLVIAEKLGWKEGEVLQRIKEWIDQGVIKRFGALVKHQNLGFRGNAMVAWSVPHSDVEITGKHMANYLFISHCYERPAGPDWPYNIYTMIHALDKKELESFVHRVARDTGIEEYRILYTVKEWKKKSMEYI